MMPVDSGGHSRKRRLGLLAVIGLVVGAYLGLFLLGGPSFVHEHAQGYYESLTDAFLSGQTFLKEAPDPRLAELANPWAGAQGIPRIHDATYFHGRYYLYFGAAPVVTLMAPWRILTGGFLSEAATVLLFSVGGFLAGLALWESVRRKCFPNLGAGSSLAAGLGIGFASYIPYLLDGPVFYQVASAAAFFWSMLALCFGVALASGGNERRMRAGLAAASVAWGLAVASRPNFLLGLPALGALALVLGFGRKDARASAAWKTLAAAILPALAAGLALAAYNWVRFGDPAEFGIHYQFAAGDMRQVKLAGVEFIPGNFRAYLLGACRHWRYFPFVERTGDTLGLLPWSPFLLLGVLLPLTWAFPRGRERAWLLATSHLFLAGLLLFGSLLIYAYPVDRYALDFFPTWSVLAVVFLGFVLGNASAVGRRILAAVGGLALAYSVAHLGLLVLGSSGFQPKLAGVARLLNRIPGAIERVAGTRFGAIEADVRFVPLPAGAREPLLTTGGGRDVLFAEHLGEHTVRFGFFHLGTESPLSEAFTYDPGKTYKGIFDLGSLYPPDTHPRMEAVPKQAADALHRRVEVSLEGRIV